MATSPALALRARILGAMLREARLAAGKSLRETAALIGVGAGTLASYEAGRKAISLPELEVLTYQLDIPLRRFWSEEAARPASKDELNPGLLVSLRQRMVGAQLRVHREALGWTMRDLAEKSDLPVRRLRAYERGDRPVPLPELETILTALGHTLDEYVDAEGPIADWDTNERAVDALLRMPPDLRAFLSAPGHQAYLRMAKRLSELPVEKVRSVAELLIDITQ